MGQSYQIRASGDVAHSLLELLAGGRLNVDENQSHLTALRARLHDKPQHLVSKFSGGNNLLNRISSNVDDIVQINVDQETHTVVTSTSKYYDELNFVEDTDEKNFVTEPYPAPPKTRSRNNWMINRMNPLKTTTTQAPTTTQFTLFPTFPTLFPTFQPLFGSFTPLNPFLLPQTTTTTVAPIHPIFNLPIQTTTVIPSTTTSQSEKKVESKNDTDLLKPYRPTPKSDWHTKLVGAKMKIGGEKINKQENEDSKPTEDSTDQPEKQSSNDPKENPTTNLPEKEDDESGKEPKISSAEPQTTQSNNGPGSSRTPPPEPNNNSGKDDDEATTKRPDHSGSGDHPTPKSSGQPDENNENSGSGSGNPKNDDDFSGEPSSTSKCTDGKWSEWKEKFPCDGNCGACGRVHRERECLSFKNGKGCPCTGDYKQIEPCNIEVCRFPKPSCCPPYDLIYVDGAFACGPQEKHIMSEFKNKHK